MSFKEHLRELIFRCVVAAILTIGIAVLVFSQTSDIMAWLVECANINGYSIITVSPHEYVAQFLRVGFLCGFVLALPVWVWELYRFAVAGSAVKWQLFGIALCCAAVLLLHAGVFFTIKFLLPVTLKFLSGVQSIIISSVSLEEFVNFIVAFTMTVAVFVEAPVICVLVVTTGVVRAKTLWATLPYAVVLIFVVAAFATPPDVVSQVVVAVPMVAIYWLGLVVCSIVDKVKHKVMNKGKEANA